MKLLLRRNVVVFFITSILPLSLFAQQPDQTQAFQDLIPIQKGDVFSVSPGNSVLHNYNLPSKILTAAGVAIASYKPMTIVGPDKASSKTTPDYYQPIGAGIILGSNKLARSNKRNYQLSRYTLFDQTGKILETHIVRITNKELKRNGGNITLGSAKEDGYVKVESLNAEGEFSTDYSLNRTPGRTEDAVDKNAPDKFIPIGIAPVNLAVRSFAPSVLRATPLPAAIAAKTTAINAKPAQISVTRQVLNTRPSRPAAPPIVPVSKTPLLKQETSRSLKRLPLPDKNPPTGRLPFLFPVTLNPKSDKDGDETPEDEKNDEEDAFAPVKQGGLKPDLGDDDDDDDDEGYDGIDNALDDDDGDDGDGGDGDDDDDGVEDLDGGGDGDGASDGDDDDDDDDDGDGDDSPDGNPGFYTNNGSWVDLPPATVIGYIPSENDDPWDLYSLYYLNAGDDPNDAGEYTTDPTDPTAQNTYTLAPYGTVKGTDPNFKKGQTSGTPIITYAPFVINGWTVTFGYNLTTSNGITTITVNNLTASLFGVVINNSWTNLASSYSYNQATSTLSFSITGTLNYNMFPGGVGTIAQQNVVVTGTYNTSNGQFTVNVANPGKN